MLRTDVRLVVRIVQAVGGLAMASFLHAQCEPFWQGRPLGTDAPIRAVAQWDPDGAGPLQSQLVLAGEFQTAGRASANRVAAFDGRSWQALGAGPDGDLRALTTTANGELVIAGTFATAGAVAANNVASWNGSSWSALGTGLDGEVRALVTLPNGDVVAGGSFANAGGVSAANIACWDGGSWHALGAGMDARVNALVVAPNGDLVAAGAFGIAGGTVTSRVARWDGSTWSALGAGFNAEAHALTVAQNGDIVAGGEFTSAGTVAFGLARWNGVAWSAFGSGTNGFVYALTTMSGGALAAGGWFTAVDGVQANRVATFDGSTWSPLGNGVEFPGVHALGESPDGSLVVAGEFQGSIVEGTYGYCGFWQDDRWLDALYFNVSATAWLPNGDLVLGGTAATIGTGPDPGHIARWDGTDYVPLGQGVDDFVLALQTLPGGDLIAAGTFANAGGLPANGIARWDGSTWHAMSSGVDGSVSALAVLPSGDLVVGGAFQNAGGVAASNVARWDGTNWHSMGFAPAYSQQFVTAMAIMSDGSLAAAGPFHVSRWDGTAWSLLGSYFSGFVSALVALPDGGLVAGGSFLPGRIARWDGNSWSEMGAGFDDRVAALVRLPNGDVVAGGAFDTADGSPAMGVARWHGTSWSAVDGGVGGNVYTLITRPAGGLVAAGIVGSAGDMRIWGVAWLDAPCAATATPYGAGCPGPNGVMPLSVTQKPWLGATFEARVDNLPSTALVAEVTGLQAVSIPLAPLLPAAGAGCDLLASVDLLNFAVTTTGTSCSTLQLPNDASLVGTVLYHQIVPLEVDAQLSILSVSATDAVELTLGTY